MTDKDITGTVAEAASEAADEVVVVAASPKTPTPKTVPVTTKIQLSDKIPSNWNIFDDGDGIRAVCTNGQVFTGSMDSFNEALRG